MNESKLDRVLHHFLALCALPHPSHHTGAAAAYCCRFAGEHGLFSTMDAAGNVLIRKAASAGMEDRPGVILQGHLDMVAEKDPGVTIDFEKDGLDVFREGDLLGARGTTLGGDDGIAVAMILAVLEDESLPHPAIEAVFTTDEEVGMLGADAMDLSVLRGRRLLNLDSEDEGILTVSCAGGARVDLSAPGTRTRTAGPLYTVSVSGLLGGHSGTEIDKGRANANRLLAELLHGLCGKYPVSLVTFAGGSKDNAIPNAAECSFYAPAEAASDVERFAAAQKKAYRDADPALALTYTVAKTSTVAWDAESTRRMVTLLFDIPCGVVAMSADMPGLVETSLNLGIVRTEKGGLAATYSVRSSRAAAKEALLSGIRTAAAAAGVDVTVRGDYPAWEYRKESPLRDTVCRVYRELSGKEMQVVAIHAGLECGIFSSRLPGVECVSFGPDMQNIHTTRERLSVSSTARTYELLTQVLAAL